MICEAIKTAIVTNLSNIFVEVTFNGKIIVPKQISHLIEI